MKHNYPYREAKFFLILQPDFSIANHIRVEVPTGDFHKVLFQSHGHSFSFVVSIYPALITPSYCSLA